MIADGQKLKKYSCGRYQILLLLGVMVLAAPGWCAAPAFHEPFEEFERVAKRNPDVSSSVGVVSGVFGRAIEIRGRACVRLPPSAMPQSESGTIMFWFRPNWSSYDIDRGNRESQTLMSMRFEDGSYMVISDGWWEDSRIGNRLFFVLNNKQKINIHADVALQKGRWAHFAFTWKSLDAGGTKIAILINGHEVIAKVSRSYAPPKIEDLFVGCDRGTTLSDGRFSTGVFDEYLAISDALTEEEVVRFSRIQEPNAQEKVWEWIDADTTPRSIHERQGAVSGKKTFVFDSYPASWQTREQARHTIARLKAANIDVYVPCVWYGDGARYRSEVAPLAVYKGNGAPLQRLIEIAHSQGIEVHAWVAIARRSRDFLEQYVEDGTPPGAFEIHNPEFRSFILSVAEELIREFNLDGLNLDFIRTMGISRSRSAAKAFADRYASDYFRELQRLPADGASDRLLLFYGEQIRELVKGVSMVRNAIRPQMVLSVDGHPAPKFEGRSIQGRNEVEWANEGLIDLIFAMHYERHLDMERLHLVRNEMDDPNKLSVLIGAFDKEKGPNVQRPVELIARQLIFLKRSFGSNVGIYPLYFLSDMDLQYLRAYQ